MAARLQDRNADPALCVQRHAVTWQSHLLPHVEEANQDLGGRYRGCGGRVSGRGSEENA